MKAILKKDWWMIAIFIIFGIISQAIRMQYQLVGDLIEIPFWHTTMILVFILYSATYGSIILWMWIYTPLLNMLANRWGAKYLVVILIFSQGTLMLLCNIIFYPYIKYIFSVDQSYALLNQIDFLLCSVGAYLLMVGYRLLTKKTLQKVEEEL